MKFHRPSVLVSVLASALLLAACSSEQAPPEQASTASTEKASVAKQKKAPSQYDAKTFYETVTYGGSSINHAGDAVLQHSDETGVFNLYKVSLIDGSRSQLTKSTEESLFAVSFFPGDDRVLYSADKGGNELDHLYVLELDGSVKDLTPGENLKAMFNRFSADGAHFYVHTNERDPKFFDVYRYDSKTYAREMVYQNKDGLQPSALSSDGRWLALSKSNNNADSDILIVDLQSKTQSPTLISKHEGFVQYSPESFTPDNQSLIYTTDAEGEFYQAYQFDLNTAAHKPYLSADWDISFIYFSDDGRFRVHGINADASTQISIYDMKASQPLNLPAMPAGDMRGVSFSDDGKRMAFYLNGDTSPSNLYVYDLEKNDVRRLTNALSAAIDESDLVASEVIRYDSTDKLKIPALQFKPYQASADNKVPGIIYIHGGPGGQTRKGYNPIIQHLVNHGYAVLGVNNRGSSGYGKTFFHLDDKKHGEKDLEDIVAAKTYLQSLPWIDGDKIVVMGGSYGGYLTMAALAFTNEFQAGINIFGVTNWLRTLESIPPWWASFRDSLYAEMGDPATDKERLHRISPLFHAKNVKVPVLVVQGANDPRVLQVESDEIVAAIKENGVPVEYVLFPDEGHGFSKKANRIAAAEAYLKFLDAHVRHATPAPQEAAQN